MWMCSWRPSGVTPDIRHYLAEHAFAQAWFFAPDDVLLSVGVNRFAGTPAPLQPEQHVFTFMQRE